MTRTRRLPQFVVVLLALVALVVLGPPVLALTAGLLGLALGLAAVALKVGLVVLAVYAVVALVRAVFGGPSPRTDERGEDVFARLDASRRALDEELERATASGRRG